MLSSLRTLVGGTVFLLGTTVLSAQATWNFTTGPGATSTPANLSATYAAGPAATAQSAYNSTSPSTAAYPGASGGNNASVRAAAGTYFEFTLTPATGYKVTATGLTLGSRSDATGPTTLALYSSTDNYATALGSVTVSANSTWASVSLPAFSASSATGAAVTLRLIGSGGTGTATAGNWRIDDVSIAATAAALPTVTTPANQTGSLGATVTFSVVAAGTGPLSYQWRKGSTAITGNPSATTDTLTLTNLASTDAGSYSVVVTDSVGSRTSTAATLTYAKSPVAIFLSGLAPTYDGNPKPVTVTTYPAGRVATITYDSSTTAPTNAGIYRVAATVNDTDYQGTATDLLVIQRAPAVLRLGGLAATYNGTARTPTFTTSPFGLDVTLSYDGSPDAPVNAGTYTVVATITAANYQGTATAPFTIARAPQSLAFPRPADRSIADSPVALAASASSGLAPSYTVVSGGATVVGSTLVLDGTTGTIVVRASQAGDANHLPTADVQQSFHVVTTLIPPSFSTQPTGAKVLAGDAVRFEAFATGSPAPTYQWTRFDQPMAGGTSSTLVLATTTPADSGIYRVAATNVAGTTLSDPVTLQVEKRSQTIAFTLPATPLPANQPVPLNATASSGLPVALTLVSGPASLSGGALTGTGGDVVIRATQAGNATYLAAAPVERTVTFTTGGTAPFFSSAPADVTVNTGATAVLRSAAVGNPAPRYQWKRAGVPLAGATEAALTLNAVTLNDAGTYTIEATNTLGTATASATLAVRAAPTFSLQPASATVARGEAVTLTTATTGFPAPTYQWRRNGTAIPGATGASLTLAAAGTADAGRYDVVATNALGTATSASATLTVTFRDFAGTYLGAVAGGGDFALQVQPDNTAVLLAYLPGRATALAATGLVVDGTGAFSGTTTTLAGASTRVSPLAEAPPVAGAPQVVTIRGVIDDVTGAVSASITEFDARLAGNRTTGTGPASSLAGYYVGAAIGSTGGRAFALVAASGQTYGLLGDGTAVDRISGQLDSAGRLAVTSPQGVVVSATFTVTGWSGTLRTPAGVTAPLAGTRAQFTGAERLVNVSVRAVTAPGAANLITGFIVAGPAPKRILVRVAGPTLAVAPFNLPGVLANPTLQLFRGFTLLGENDDWTAPAASAASLSSAATAVGAFPLRAGAADAALIATVEPGAYSLVVGGGSGTVVAEVYEYLESNEPVTSRRLTNLSARGVVAAGNPLIAGFVLGGLGPQRVLIRAIGPTLGAAPFNVAGVLANPVLTLTKGAATVRTNDDWFKDADAAAIRTAAAAVGAFALPAQSLDAALLVYLDPGAYTAQATATTPNGQGIVLLEVYEVR